MVKTAIRTTVYIAIALLLLTALVGVTPTEAGTFIREMWQNVLEFLRSVFGSTTAA